MLRGHVKSNLQYNLINSKTRNGTFGLKSWVSSHCIKPSSDQNMLLYGLNFLLNKIIHYLVKSLTTRFINKHPGLYRIMENFFHYFS
jgi:hypothetical protein